LTPSGVTPFCFLVLAAVLGRGDCVVINVAFGENLQTVHDGASSGDELVLADGTYTGSGTKMLQINKDITIRAANSLMAILDGQDARRVISITSGTVFLDGLRIINGAQVGSSGDDRKGGGMFINGGTVTVQNTHISDSSARFGGGVNCNGGTASFTDVEIYNNRGGTDSSSYDSGGGVDSKCTLTMTRAKIYNNNCECSTHCSGGGLFKGGGVMDLYSIELYGNTATMSSTDGTPNGLYQYSGVATIYGSQGGALIQDPIDGNPIYVEYPPSPPTAPAPWMPGQGGGDPHLVFANGGRADFRGSDRANFVFLSSPGYQFAPYFQEAHYFWHNPMLAKQLVHGTFMTGAHWVIRTSAGKTLRMSTDAMQSGEINMTIDNVSSPVKRWSTRTVDDVTIKTRMLSVNVTTAMWTVNATAKYIYGQCQADGSPRSWWKEKQLKRLDIFIRGAFPQVDAHGIIGQSYRNARVRNGAQDSYDVELQRVNEIGMAPPMTTRAQAEGAIDGNHTSYMISSPYSTLHPFSRYGRMRDSSTAAALETRESYSMEKYQP